jgi:hypothetical protein
VEFCGICGPQRIVLTDHPQTGYFLAVLPIPN